VVDGPLAGALVVVEGAVVALAGGAVVDVVAPGSVVDVVSSGSDDDVVDSSGTVEDVVVDEVVVVASSTRTDGLSRRPGKLRTGTNEPVSIPSVARLMNLRQMSAGNDPPVTDRPWTLSISRCWPSG